MNEAAPTADTHFLRTALAVPRPHAIPRFPILDSGGAGGLLDRSLEVEGQVRQVVSALTGQPNGD